MKVKKIAIGATVMVLLLLWLVTPGFAGATVVKIEPSTQNVLAGEGFSVDVTIEDITDMAANGAILHFEHSSMQATGITAGVISTFPVTTIDNTAGTVTFAYALQTGSYTGSGVLATIEFTAAASAEGTFELDLTDVELYDPNLNLIPTGVSNGTVTITSKPTPTPTSTPTTGGNGGARRDALPRKTPTPTPTPTITPVPIPSPTEEEKTYENITVAKKVTVEILDKELTITFKKNVSGVKITAKEFIEKPAGVPDAPGIVFKYQEYTIENVSAEDIEKAMIPFDVPKSWIASENIDPVTIKLNRYYEGAWNPLPTEKIGEDDENIHYSAEAEGLSIFAITGEKKTEAPVTTPSSAILVWGVLGVVLLIVVIVIGVWYIKKRRQ